MDAFTDTRRQILESFLRSAISKPLIVIVGPTASGKTAFSIQLAKELLSLGKTSEIVNADSRQFYRGLDVGTAKITQKEMEEVPHHLLSVLSPREPSTISWFKERASRVIEEIHTRGNVPILVGGSMLYVSALVDGLEPIPPADPAIRERLLKEYDADGGETLFRKLSEIDPETAASFPKQNKVYVVRALEIFESTGKTKSEQRKVSGSPYDLLMIGMDRPMEELKSLISERTKAMLENGWIEEVRRLKEAGFGPEDPGMKSIGYREILGFLEGQEGRKAEGQGDGDVDSLSVVISSQTRAYAKRHMTWWKKDPRIRWIRQS